MTDSPKDLAAFTKKLRESIGQSLVGQELTPENRDEVLVKIRKSLTELLTSEFGDLGDHIDVIASPDHDQSRVNVTLIAKTDYGQKIVQDIERNHAEAIIRQHHDVEDILELPTGYNLYVVKRDNGTYVYYTDEVAGGCLAWDPSLVDESTINTAMQHHYTGGGK